MAFRLSKLTPNLIVADVERSVAFYRDVLGFTVVDMVPEAAPFVFAIVRSGAVDINLNAPEPAVAEYPVLGGRAIGGTLTLFVEVEDVRGAWVALSERVLVVMPLETKWYGLTEFAFTDPDGWVITFFERGVAPATA